MNAIEFINSYKGTIILVPAFLLLIFGRSIVDFFRNRKEKKFNYEPGVGLMLTDKIEMAQEEIRLLRAEYDSIKKKYDAVKEYLDEVKR